MSAPHASGGVPEPVGITFNCGLLGARARECVKQRQSALGAFVGEEVCALCCWIYSFRKSQFTFSLYPSAQVGSVPVQMQFGLQMLTDFKALEIENPRLGTFRF